MYSPAARPSRQRAAPAKKRRLSTRNGHLVLAHRLDRLADVQRLEPRELVGVLLDRVGDPEQRQRALARRCLGPLRKGPLGGLHRGIDVRLVRERRGRDRLAGGGVQDRLACAVGGGRSSPSMKFWISVCTRRSVAIAPLLSDSITGLSSGLSLGRCRLRCVVGRRRAPLRADAGSTPTLTATAGCVTRPPATFTPRARPRSRAIAPRVP